MRARIGRLLACVVFGASSTSEAVAAWTPAFPLTDPVSAVSDVGVGFWRDGTAVLTWRALPLETPMDNIPRGSELGYVAIHELDGTRITRLTTP